MSSDFWNERYATEDYIFGTAPNVFLASQSALIRPGMRALAIADGEGRNGVWLAEQGAQVHAIDVSPFALDKAKKLAAERGVTLNTEQADVLSWTWPQAAYDLVAAIFIQFAPPPERDRIIQGIRRTLKPGGVLILQGYTPKQVEYGTGGPPSAANMYTAELLRDWFGDWDIRHLHEHESFISEGTHHHGMSALIDLVAIKPAARGG
ncbi:MAG: class I SAM-dependent methyltransferase [Thiobacillaceae bacterium]|jgi:SAM-dependent methyltransferase|nr:class I SAM-dependent methyltransferase [Thiobacillaceae bacterium]